MSHHFWNRDELYEQVWSEPVTKVAVRHGVSDVAIAKVCRKLSIPIPGRGYWAKKAHGYPVKRAPLPKLQQSQAVRRSVVEPRTPPMVPPKPSFPVEKEDAREVDRISELLSGGALAIPSSHAGLRHPLVKASRLNLRQGYRDHRGVLRPPRNESCLDIRVSKQSLKRALDIMRMMIWIIEKNGMKVKVARCGDSYRGPREPDYETSLVIFNEKVRFALFERFRKVRQVPADSKTASVGWEPTGMLSIQVLTHSNLCKQLWEDTEHLKLEQSLPEIVATMMKIGVEYQRASERRLQEERIGSFERRKLQRLEQWRAAEEIRVERLKEAADRWARAKRIRDYVFALAQCCIGRGKQLTPKSALGKWVVWALEKADQIDPLADSPFSTLD